MGVVIGSGLWLLGLLVRLLRWLAHRPFWAVGVLVCVVAAVTDTWWQVLYVINGAAAVLLAWGLTLPDSYHRFFAQPLARWSRVRRVYRRDWETAMVMSGLGRNTVDGPIVPKLLGVDCEEWADQVEVGMLMGQSLSDYEHACDALATSFGAPQCRVWSQDPGIIWLTFRHGDPLAQTIPALPIPTEADLGSVPVGVREDGRPWVLQLLGTHLFIAGVTGSGKGSILWSLLRGIAPAISSGTVRVWACDPKGGMELSFGRPMFTRFAADSTAAMVCLLEDAVTVMDDRARRMAGITRLHSPTVDEPMILLVVDELASLTAYEPDRKLRDRATAALSALLTKGRAVAVVVVAAAQDPRKEIVGFRSLFPTKVALRLDTPSQVDMVLGEGMHGMG
ncbi:MAG: cell division protein FtsK, partial [Geodermatophilaceae bacterium]|nr:cell division protein FtsK [Geodermatophilaceae bacterium]